MATVKASTEQAQGHIASTFRPFSLNTLRKASHEVRDPGDLGFSKGVEGIGQRGRVMAVKLVGVEGIGKRGIVMAVKLVGVGI